MTRNRLILLLLSSACLLTSVALADDDWLIDADEKTRAERLSSYLGGFSASMWEVGERYERMIQAIGDENFELASYHWDKIGSAIRGGYLKRPGRQANADALFLEAFWPTYLETLQSGEGDRIRQQFSQARAACMACHVAEELAFMNNQPMFNKTGFDD